MNQKQLDIELRTRFLGLIDDATELAKQQADIESLGSLAQLVGTCIDWDDDRQSAAPVGFGPGKVDEDE